MKILLVKCITVCMTIFLFASCNKKSWDEYYARPDWLAQPIYQQLDSMGDFKKFLVCIDKSGYKNTLGTAGSWTVFAPTDAAFQTYLQEQNIADVNQISKELAEKIVRASMVYDGERLERLNDNFSSKGWVPGFAFRRRTVYYDFVETETGGDGKSRKIISTNRGADKANILTENNNKHLTYFFSAYMDPRNLGASDYKTFYPNSDYSGLNIADAKIDPLRSNIVAENGYIHVVDKVLIPQNSIDQYLRNNNAYSDFKQIMDYFVTYSYNSEITRKYAVLTGSTDSVFTKSYTGIALALNNENYAKDDANDAQINNFSVTIPDNEAVKDYAQRVLLKYYPAGTSLKDLFFSNSSILSEFVNAHIYNQQLWPSRFEIEQNISGEKTKISKANIKEVKLLSNGAFYGVNACQNANVFQSVYGNVLLDPKYKLMQTALQRIGMNLTLKIPTLKYMLTLVSDAELNRMGFEYDPYNTTDPIRFRGGNGSPSMREVLMLHIIPLGSDPIPDLSGKGMLESYAGEYVKYDNYKMYSSGSMDSIVQYVSVDSTNIGNTESGPLNGLAVYSNKALTSSKTNIANFLKNIGAATTSSPFNKFYQYLIATDMYSASDGVIKGIDIGANYTMLIPNNAAMALAVSKGDLPAATNPSAQLDKDKVKRFIQYHIAKTSVAIDGKKQGVLETICKDIEGVTQPLTITLNTNNQLNVRDNLGNSISADFANSNLLGQRVLIHSMNGYLKHGL
ncbi:MAG TPA: fasciclin domain-containing protein [Niabella sp.]|nr:fasciclin domain-containing protein [Niabella sp.]HQW13750.1 fasciclin domain-containing protein [Niabella sp.]HQX19145.1 fasciclin domain-containing protein [Niabella sp.]HRB06434.1 fasciclin domain-containing protein [Niabella sp.]HRB34296.1 fasciclin domain-containing protein [Niabella sp.]